MFRRVNNKGFMMAEVIVVSAVILTTLVSLYTSYNKIFSLYNQRITYYDIDTLYELSFIRDVFLDEYTVDTTLRSVDNNKLKNQGLIDNTDTSVRKLYYISKYDILNTTGSINVTFSEYLEFLDASIDGDQDIIYDGHNYKWDNLLIMEKCDSDGKSNCTYAYLEVPRPLSV